jgi:hypothetical protein
VQAELLYLPQQVATAHLLARSLYPQQAVAAEQFQMVLIQVTQADLVAVEQVSLVVRVVREHLEKVRMVAQVKAVA